MGYARIIGTGSFLPEKTITNKDLEELVDTNDEWIIERTGINQRHVVSEGEDTTTMTVAAARQAIEASQIGMNDIGLIIVATSSATHAFPSTACVLQNQLGITNNCPAFDVNAACAGFIYGLDIANQYIQSGAAKHVLLVGADALSKMVDWTDRSTCILFSDGAGAVVLKEGEEAGVLSTDTYANGSYKDLLYVENRPGSHESPAYIKMRGNEVFRLAVNALGALVDEALEKNNISQSDIDWLIPHQANLRIIKATAKRLNLPLDKVVLTVQDQGNTSAASIPLALDIAVRDGRVRAGQLLLLEAFGGGLAWGSALVRY